MSRNYEVQVELVPCTDAELSQIREVLETWGMEFEDQTEWFTEEGDGWAFWGTMKVNSGPDLDDRHDDLAGKFPTRWVCTRWRDLDDLPWDETFESEPIPASLTA